MNLFFDTSALVKFFHEEEGSGKVIRLVMAEENEKWVSELARVEFISALHRRYRNNELDDNDLAEAVSGFEEEMASFNVESMGHSVIAEAELLLKRFGKAHGLRTLDALHLATFNLIADADWVYVVSDKNLCAIVRMLGFKAVNPLE